MQAEQELSTLLSDWTQRVLRLMMAEVSHFSRRKGISNNQLDLLMVVSHRNPCDMTALCKHMQISRPAGSQAVKRLQQLGLVEVFPSTEDQRVKLVQLSVRGQALIDEYNADHKRVMRTLAGMIPPEAQQQALATLRHLNQGLVDYAGPLSGIDSD